MKDHFGREIDYLRVSVTDRCNLRCTYCMSESGIQDIGHGTVLRNEELLMIIKESVGLGIRKIRITGGEPLVRKGIVELVGDIAALKGVDEVVMTTNGILLPQYIRDLKEAGLDRVNISLDSLRADRFNEITRLGELHDVLEGLHLAMSLGMGPVKLNTVLIGGFNDDEIEDFVVLTRDYPLEVRFIELMPIGEAIIWPKDRFLSNDVVLERMPELKPLEIQDPSSPATYYRLPGGKGRVGLISPISCQFCGHCNRLRLTADGKIKPCLHSDEEIDLMRVLRENTAVLQEEIRKAIALKPYSHRLGDDGGIARKRNMNQIGG